MVRTAMSRGSEGVLLGVAGTYVAIDDPIDPRTTKVGGQARWWAGGTPTDAQLVCNLCQRGPMRLLMQTYAPLHLLSEGFHIEKRTLYVFVCPHKSCHDQERGWKAFRSQASPEVGPVDSFVEAAAPAVDGWADASWEDDSMEDETMDDLMNMLEAGASTEKENQRQHELSRSVAGTTNGGRTFHTVEDCYPEYYIIREVDRPCKLENAYEEHVKLLLERYEREHPGEANALAKGQDATAGWSGEQYEKGQSRSATSQFLKFSMILEQNPRQCLRYGFGTSPLWPTVPAPTAAVCPFCSHERVFEMQLMPALIMDLFEAAELGGWENTGTSLHNVPSEWCTVGVWTCGRSCLGGQIIEESIKIAHES